MKISRWGKKAGNGTPGIMVRVNYLEAVALIKSLSSQLDAGPGVLGNRLESTAEDGSYFSVAVIEDHPAAIEARRLREELDKAITDKYYGLFIMSTSGDEETTS